MEQGFILSSVTSIWTQQINLHHFSELWKATLVVLRVKDDPHKYPTSLVSHWNRNFPAEYWSSFTKNKCWHLWKGLGKMLSVSFCSSISQQEQEIHCVWGFWSYLWSWEWYWGQRAKRNCGGCFWGGGWCSVPEQDTSGEEEDPDEKSLLCPLLKTASVLQSGPLSR